MKTSRKLNRLLGKIIAKHGFGRLICKSKFMKIAELMTWKDDKMNTVEVGIKLAEKARAQHKQIFKVYPIFASPNQKTTVGEVVLYGQYTWYFLDSEKTIYNKLLPLLKRKPIT